MDSVIVEQLNESFEKLLKSPSVDPSPSLARPLSPPAIPNTRDRLPGRIDGGFGSITSELNRRNRDIRSLLRVLDKQKPDFEAAQMSYSDALARLAAFLPEIEASSQSLMEALEGACDGDEVRDIGPRFDGALDSLDELESMASSLVDAMLGLRSTWEQYAQTILKAQRLSAGQGAPA